MQKDLKTGYLLGLVLIAVAAIWLSTRQSLSVKSRILKSNKPASQQNATEEKVTAEQLALTTIAKSSDTSRQNNPDTLSTTNTPVKEPRATSDEQRAMKFHIVQRGETLSDISYKYYGTANKWQKILDANRHILDQPNKLMPAMRLIIPE